MTLPDFVLKKLNDLKEERIAEELAKFYSPEDEEVLRETYEYLYNFWVNDLEYFSPVFETVWQNGHSWGWNDRAVLASQPDHVEHQNPFEEES